MLVVEANSKDFKTQTFVFCCSKRRGMRLKPIIPVPMREKQKKQKDHTKEKYIQRQPKKFSK